MEKKASGDETSVDLTIIAPTGDIVLDVCDETREQTHSYRVSTVQLTQASPYFASLLDPNKFGEGAQVAETLALLKKRYGDIEDAPIEELPRVVISDIGRISRVNTMKNLVFDFLSALHGLDLSTPSPPISNLANLTVVADRFDALPLLSHYVHRKRFLRTIDAKARGKTFALSEERVRQKLLIGLLLDHPDWVSVYSKRLIIGGSVRWRDDISDEVEPALWWDIPRGIEGNKPLSSILLLMKHRNECMTVIQITFKRILAISREPAKISSPLNKNAASLEALLRIMNSAD
jgi:hypothetical protein